MKHKICSILLSLIILIGAAGFSPAAAEPDTADRVTDLVSGIAAYMEASDGSHSLQELLDGFISSYAGSGGEWFAIALKQAQVALVVAQGFARIFRRNCINIGMPVFVADAVGKLKTGEIIEVDLEKGTINAPCGVIQSAPLSENVLKTLEYGGLIPRVRAELGIA